jgi:hypothetical protein
MAARQKEPGARVGLQTPPAAVDKVDSSAAWPIKNYKSQPLKNWLTTCLSAPDANSRYPNPVGLQMKRSLSLLAGSLLVAVAQWANAGAVQVYVG